MTPIRCWPASLQYPVVAPHTILGFVSFRFWSPKSREEEVGSEIFLNTIAFHLVVPRAIHGFETNSKRHGRAVSEDPGKVKFSVQLAELIHVLVTRLD